eukprot:scaffold1650_cov351-Prasinococcus_capsulatus_cf.AAC.14
MCAAVSAERNAEPGGVPAAPTQARPPAVLRARHARRGTAQGRPMTPGPPILYQQTERATAWSRARGSSQAAVDRRQERSNERSARPRRWRHRPRRPSESSLGERSDPSPHVHWSLSTPFPKWTVSRILGRILSYSDPCYNNHQHATPGGRRTAALSHRGQEVSSASHNTQSKPSKQNLSKITPIIVRE